MTDLHIIPRASRWRVRATGARRALRIFDTRREALAWAVDRANRVFVHRADGTVERMIDA